jgi:uncharacterized protein (DUF2141 family)
MSPANSSLTSSNSSTQPTKVYMHVRALATTLCILSCALTANAAHAGDLSLEISLPADRQGTVMVAVFDKVEGFPRGAALRTAVVQPVKGKATIRFVDLPKGDYAATAFLDENRNTKMDFNLFGIPTEPYGFSRNARGLAGPPSFAEATFRVEDSAQLQAFELK